MCGICAFIGNEDGYEYIYFGLTMLQNRGYDSAGICAINNKTNEFIIKKYASNKNNNALDLLSNLNKFYLNSNNLIGHSRWACQGAKTDINAHPHIDYTNTFSLVHNGIIENYNEIRTELFNKHNIINKSQTDTEVIVNLIGFYYITVKSTKLAIKLALNRLEGTWALVIQNKLKPNKLYCARRGSPLLIGFNENICLIGSEQSVFSNYITDYICLNDNDIVDIKYDNKIIINNISNYKINKVCTTIHKNTPEPYSHWTLKEIYEQMDIIKNIFNHDVIKFDNIIKFENLENNLNLFKNIDNLIILACGTSYHAGLYSLKIFKKISNFKTCNIFDGSEFTEYDIPKFGNSIILLLSQSGETRDLYQSLLLAKKLNIPTIGIINVEDSLIAREVDYVLYCKSGREVGVASTKVFVSQVIILYMLSIWFSQIKDIKLYYDYIQDITYDIRKLYINIQNTLNNTNLIENCKKVANYLKNQHSLFILGKSENEAIALEGALKIKEIGYIHAEGYSSSALKHGPYSLIEDGTPIIILNLDDEYKSINKITSDEVIARNSFLITITNYDEIHNNDNNNNNLIIRIEKNNTFQGLLSVIPMQLIAYYLACEKGQNPDLPRNLAKTVTVL